MTCGPRRPADWYVHSRLIVSPALVGHFDVGLRQAIDALVEEVEEDEDVVRSPVEDAIVRSPGVGSKLAELADNLARPRVGERRAEFRKTLDVVVDGELVARTQPKDCLVYRLSTAAVSVVDDWPHSRGE
jgi:hypothetical protein